MEAETKIIDESIFCYYKHFKEGKFESDPIIEDAKECIQEIMEDRKIKINENISIYQLEEVWKEYLARTNTPSSLGIELTISEAKLTIDSPIIVDLLKKLPPDKLKLIPQLIFVYGFLELVPDNELRIFLLLSLLLINLPEIWDSTINITLKDLLELFKNEK